MVLNKLELIPYQNSADPITIEFDNSLCENEQMEEDNYLAKEERAELNKKRREKDEELDVSCDSNKEHDPQYVLFLKDLKIHENSYVLEVEENGVRSFIKYDGDSGLDNESNVEPRRRLRSAMNKKNIPSKQIAGAENQHKNCLQSTPTKETGELIGRRLRNRSESEKRKSIKLSTKKIEWERVYLTFSQNFKVSGDCGVLEFEGRTVEYEQLDGENNHEKEEYNDGSFSDVEYLGSSSDKEGNLNCCPIELDDDENNHEKDDYNDDYFSNVKTLEGAICKEEKKDFSKKNEGNTSGLEDVAKYREKVITALAKPYSQQEYDKLFQDIEFRRPEERHLELRNGRERSYFLKKEGKSYLDLYPDFGSKLLQVQHDKPKCLNLLRGFFFRLKQPGPLRPWEDAKCLATEPGFG